MFDIFQGSCRVCGKFITDPTYQKDTRGHSLYWADPRLNQFTDVKLDFCGPICSSKWHIEQIEAHRNATPDTLP